MAPLMYFLDTILSMSGASAAAERLFSSHGGTMRTTEALRAGIHPRTLYALRDAGTLAELTRGVYRLTRMPRLAEPDLVAVAKRAPQAVLCLASALAFHRLTTLIPHAIDIAVARSARRPRLSGLPIRVHRFSGRSFTAGVEPASLDGVAVRVYCPEKSIADAFKLRRQLGEDVALEALLAYLRRRSALPQRVLEFARICRVEHIVRPYLMALA
jgi:predicted transcriptional regulator of viral defense system